MSMPFRNTEKTLGPLLRAPSVVCIFDVVEYAEAAVGELDEAGFGEELVYGQGERAVKGVEARNQSWVTQLYRGLQAVMSDELSRVREYEQKIADGASFVLVPLSNPNDVNRVAPIVKAHSVTLAHFLGRTGFRSL